MLRFNLNLYRLASGFISNEETRYYLGGVYVEPHKSGIGVTLTATDGHRLVCIYDADGKADESAIVNLGKIAKPKATVTRIAHIDSGSNEATIFEKLTYSNDETLERVGVVTKVRIEGTFPDYRRVVPKTFADKGSAGFDGNYLADFGKLASELAVHAGEKNSKCSTSKTNSVRVLYSVKEPNESPALILFPSHALAFGVLMPCRVPNAKDMNPPLWFNFMHHAPCAMAEAAE